MIGQLIDNRYRIDRRIGKGGFAEVYRAHDDKLGIDVAVKLLTNFGHEDEFKQRFLREAASTAKLMANSHIVTVLDCGNLNDRPYFVMELVEGITLKDLVDQSRPEVAEILRMGRQVCEAIAHAHRNGIIHRDLSLNNIMVNVKGDVKILDFGLAHSEGSPAMTSPNAVMGTRHHIAPEHLASREIDGCVDIFAFGVCLYYAVNRRYPFDAEHPASVNYLIQNSEPDPFEEYVPFDVRDVILRCLEKNPKHRFQTFDELGQELGKLRRSHQSSGDDPSTYQSIERSVKNRSSKRNPYLNRSMIKNPDDFFGREREVNRIFSRLDAEFPQSISVVGERRVGKSSLLNFVYQRRNRRRYMNHYHDAIFVFMDFQRGSDMDATQFINILFGMFEYERHNARALASGAKTLDTLRDVVEELSGQGKRIIVLMDEFDAITTNPNFDMQFFSFLRFLASNYKVAYLTSSRNDLQQMCHDKEISDSPFFNIFSNLPLRPFSREEAVELISVASQREGTPLAAYADRIIEMSGLFPLFIQMACSSAFENILEHDGGEPDWGVVARLFNDEVEPHLKYAWDRMDGNMRTVITQIATRKPVSKKLEHVSEELARLGYLVHGTDRVEVFSQRFCKFAVDHSSAGVSTKSFWGKFRGRG